MLFTREKNTRAQNDGMGGWGCVCERERKSVCLWIQTAVPKAGFVLSPSLENVTASMKAAPSLTVCETPHRHYGKQRERQTQKERREARSGSAAAAQVAKGCLGPQVGVEQESWRKRLWVLRALSKQG